MSDFQVNWLDAEGEEVHRTHHIAATLAQVLRGMMADLDCGYVPREAAQVSVEAVGGHGLGLVVPL